MLIIGLTGSIGMGKTRTAGMFRELGVPTHDSDAAVHELYASAAVAPIAARFPGVVQGGVVNRAELSKSVLGKPLALKQLEEIVHPLVAAHRAAFLSAAKAKGHKICLFDIPLLFETGADKSVNLLLVVTASASVQKTRVLARPGMTEDKFSAIVQRQMPDAEKRRRAHWLIHTSDGLEPAQRQVSAIMRALSR